MASESTHLVNIKQGDLSAIGGIDKVNSSIKQTQVEATKAGSALEQATKSNQLYELSKSADASRSALIKMRAELVRIGATEDEIQKVALSIQRNYRNAIQGATEDTKKLTRVAESAADAAKRYDDAFTKASFRSAAFGDIDTSIGTVRSLTDTISPGAGGGLTIVQDIFAAREGLERLGPGIKFLGEQAVEGSGFIGKLARSYIEANPLISNSTAGLKAMAVTILPIAAIAAAVAVAVTAFSAALDQARQAAEKEIEIEKTRARLIAEQTELLKDGDYSGAVKAAEDARKEINLLSNEKEAVLKLRDEAQKRYDALASGDLIGRSLERAAIDTYNSELAELNSTILENSSTAAHLEAALSGVEGQAAKAAEELQKQIAIDVEVAKKRLAEEAKLTAEYEKSIATIAQLKQQQDDLNKSYREASAAVLARRQLEDRRAQEDRDKTARRAQEDLDRALQSAEKAHKDNLLAIQQRGNDAILAARADLAKKEAETVQRIADLQAQFREDQAKAEAEYFKQRKRDTEDYHRDRRRAEQDFAQSQLEGLINNDITSLVLDQGAFDLEQKRSRQDRRRDRRRGREDFEGDRAEAEAALAQKIADIQAELVEYQNATAAKILAIQTQTENDLLLAQAAYDERLRLDAEERQIKSDRDAEDLRIANERRTQDRQAEDMARLVSHHAALSQIQEKAMLEQSIADGLKTKLLEVQALLQSTSAHVLNVGRGLNPDGTVIGGGGQYTGAGGSQINNPKTNAPIGPSNVTPFSPQFTGGQNTRGRGGDGGGNMSVQITPQVVEIGGMQFVPFSVFEESINAVVAGIGRARNQRAG